MPKHIAILYNPLTEKAGKVNEQIVSVLQRKNIAFVSTGNWPAVLHDFTDVWVVGGDGTLNYFINKYPDCAIPISIFKGGTGNDFSWKLYGTISVEEQVEKALQAEPKKVDAAHCNDKIYINSLGIGFDGEVLKSMKSVRRVGGHLGYLLIVLKKIFSFREFSFSIKTAEQEFAGKYLIVMANNNVRTGGGFMVTPAAEIDDGRLDLLLCRKMSILNRFLRLPAIEKGRHINKPYTTNIKMEQASISINKTVLASLDGELISGNKFEIKVLPGNFLFSY